MNERIKELVKKAGGHISMRNLASNPVQHIESVELWDDRIEKFAELIIRECGVALNPPVQVRNIISRGQAYDLIKQHFGVEE